MSRPITRKLDFEKGKSAQAAQKPDYRERFRDEGDAYDRGGVKEDFPFSFRRNSVVVDLSSFLAEDRQKLVRKLERHTLFSFAGYKGYVCSLRGRPQIGPEVAERFGIIRSSILFGTWAIGTVTKPGSSRELPLIEFRCTLKPVPPFPEIFYMKWLAFTPKLVGAALDPG
jgi:hypothetical protein